MSVRAEGDLGRPTDMPSESASLPWEGLRSFEIWDLSFNRAYPSGREGPFQKQSADESRNDKITLGFFLCA